LCFLVFPLPDIFDSWFLGLLFFKLSVPWYPSPDFFLQRSCQSSTLGLQQPRSRCSSSSDLLSSVWYVYPSIILPSYILASCKYTFFSCYAVWLYLLVHAWCFVFAVLYWIDSIASWSNLVQNLYKKFLHSNTRWCKQWNCEFLEVLLLIVIRGNPRCDVLLINDHLKMRTCCVDRN